MCETAKGYRHKCPKCRCTFFVCVKCFRGQKYCSSTCTKQARTLSQKKANKRYGSTPTGRKKRRLAQNRLRNKKNVIEHTSPLPHNPVNENSSDLLISPIIHFMECIVCKVPLVHLLTSVWRKRKKRRVGGNKPRAKSSNAENVLC